MPDKAMIYEGPTPIRSARTPEALATEILEKLTYAIGKDPIVARQYDWMQATILAVRDRIIDIWMDSTRTTWRNNDKRVYYFSMEFLIGRLMRDAFSNIEFVEPVREALKQYDVNLDELFEIEPDAALGNGGLGRLAACFMESMSSVEVPAYGYGIRYIHGMFRQEVSDGWQVEIPEDWLAHGNPWEFERLESAYEVGFGGQVVPVTDPDGTVRHDWQPDERLLAVAFDTPIVGWRAKRVNTLRLWSAQPIDPLLLDRFNSGDHIGALAESARAESITQVLYPADATEAGQELRFKQEFFFCSASLQDILRRHIQQYNDLGSLAEHTAIQLNDTHPAISVVELLRLLIDKHGMAWGEAWRIAKAVFSYTNHTLLPEALESWPIGLLERLLPRHVQIIYGINAIVLKEAREHAKFNNEQVSRVSLINEAGGRRVRMGHLAFVGSHSVNGVSALHTDLMKKTVFADLHALYPERINNKTNGITPRRWLMQCNSGLTGLIREAIGDSFLDRLTDLKKLETVADDKGFQKKFADVKHANKERLAQVIRERLGVQTSPDAMFDVQVKRIHEYKRQLLNIVEAVAYYDAIRAHPEKDWVPRVKVFGGKAAPSYWNAKLIIKLINDVARIVNHDPTCSDLLKVVFLPNYNVSLAESIIPAADLSEQISTAGLEASGTGNMKFALNGALTIGTLDGANIEIRDHVGADNIVIFGKTAEEVVAARNGGASPREIIDTAPELKQALDAIAGGVFSPDDRNRYKDLVGSLYNNDWFMVARDFEAYFEAQRGIDKLWTNNKEWYSKTIRNTANMAWFSSDRTIREYAKDIWQVRANEAKS